MNTSELVCDQLSMYKSLGRAEASPTLITRTRKSLYLCMYVCMYVCMYMYICLYVCM